MAEFKTGANLIDSTVPWVKLSASDASQGLIPLEAVQHMWQNLSRRFFDNRLPPISIEWSARLTASAGLFVSRVGPRSLWVSPDYRQGKARVIKLSAPLLRHQPEEELWATLAHEMIHQWQFDIRKHRPTHGVEFRRMMYQMNAEGLGVTIRHRLIPAANSWNRYGWQCLQCGMTYYRQRRTINPSRHNCGRCRGTLVELGLSLRMQNNEATPPEQLNFHFNFCAE